MKKLNEETYRAQRNLEDAFDVAFKALLKEQTTRKVNKIEEAVKNLAEYPTMHALILQQLYLAAWREGQDAAKHDNCCGKQTMGYSI
jgi:plasmid stabilization system protein ParE